MSQKYSQGRYWILTVPHHAFVPYLPPTVVYCKGQLELGAGRRLGDDETRGPGFLHWQFIACFDRKRRLRHVRDTFGPYHAEVTKSDAANDYVWKEDTRIEGTQFELGEKPMVRGRSLDWELIRTQAQRGRLGDIPADIYIRNYNALCRIAKDNLQPVAQERRVRVYWGPTGTGKSRTAWSEAGLQAYPKDPRTKFWDGYNTHPHVVMDEFRGDIDIAHLLRWFDRYPVIVECKGSATVLNATCFWITSNLSPEEWYPTCDRPTIDALLRRLEITHMDVFRPENFI